MFPQPEMRSCGTITSPDLIRASKNGESDLIPSPSTHPSLAPQNTVWTRTISTPPPHPQLSIILPPQLPSAHPRHPTHSHKPPHRTAQPNPIRIRSPNPYVRTYAAKHAPTNLPKASEPLIAARLQSPPPANPKICTSTTISIPTDSFRTLCNRWRSQVGIHHGRLNRCGGREFKGRWIRWADRCGSGKDDLCGLRYSRLLSEGWIFGLDGEEGGCDWFSSAPLAE